MLIDQYEIHQDNTLKEIQVSIQEIQSRLEKEVSAKQRTIERQENEIHKLRVELDTKSSLIVDLNTKFHECQRTSDGNRQLINKLLNDLERAQQDVEWYKRTYESRSVLGVLKDRVKTLFMK
jgi:chromosome segregation ATPase